MILAVDIRGTICEGRKPMTKSMANRLRCFGKNLFIITGQDINDPQVRSVMKDLPDASIYTNEGALFWKDGVCDEEYSKDNRMDKEQQKMILKMVNFFVKARKVPLHEKPKVWSDVQVSSAFISFT